MHNLIFLSRCNNIVIFFSSSFFRIKFTNGSNGILLHEILQLNILLFQFLGGWFRGRQARYRTIKYSRSALPLSVFNRPISCLPTPKPEEPENDAASTWWLDPTPSRPNGVTTTGGRPPRPHPTHITSNLFLPSHLTISLQLHRISHSLLD